MDQIQPDQSGNREEKLRKRWELLDAIRKKDMNLIKKLVAKRYDLGPVYNETTQPIHVAAEVGDCGIFKYLIECKADPNALDANNQLPVTSAAAYGHLDLINFLCEECNADVHACNNQGSQALHCSAFWGHLEVVQYLVEQCNADLETRDDSGKTPLMLAQTVDSCHKGAAIEQKLAIAAYLKSAVENGIILIKSAAKA